MIITAASALAVAGCGSSGSGSGSSGASPTAPTVATDVTSGPAPIPKDAPHPPKHASPVLREIYRQFVPPQADARVKGSAAAIAAGKRACSGKTPVQVKEQYYPIAIQQGALKAGSEEGKMIDNIDTFAKRSSKDASFATGQLAADAYQATLPAKTGQFGYQGCIYVLARQLEQQLGGG